VFNKRVQEVSLMLFTKRQDVLMETPGLKPLFERYKLSYEGRLDLKYVTEYVAML
jgi:hypothetical protein